MAIKMVNSTEPHVIGTNHSNSKAHKNGLDEIDLWAMGVGNCERHLKSITPRKKERYVELR